MANEDVPAVITFDIESIRNQNRQQLHDVILAKELLKQQEASERAQAELDAAHERAEELKQTGIKRIKACKATYAKKIEEAARDETKEKRKQEMDARVFEIRNEMKGKMKRVVDEAQEKLTFVNEQNDPSKNPAIQEIHRKTSLISYQANIFCICAKEMFSGKRFRAYAPLDSNYMQAEKRMIETFFEWISRVGGVRWPVLAGFNILGFDIPLLDMRAVKHRIAKPPFLIPKSKWNHPNHFDVMDRMTHWNTFGKNAPSVAEALAFFGLPSHKGEMDGSMVWDYVLAQKYDEVVAYCDTDVDAEELLVMEFLTEINKAMNAEEVRQSRFS